MPTFTVEVHGQVRELYSVEADSPEEARKAWAEYGYHYLSESWDTEVVDVREDDE